MPWYISQAPVQSPHAYLGQMFVLQESNVQRPKRTVFLVFPTFSERITSLPRRLHDSLIFSDRSLYPPFPVVSHHDHFVSVASVLVLCPWLLPIRKIGPKLRMSRSDVFQSLKWVPELERHEDEVDVDPVVRLLIKWTCGEWITDVEYVAIHLLVGLC